LEGPPLEDVYRFQELDSDEEGVVLDPLAKHRVLQDDLYYQASGSDMDLQYADPRKFPDYDLAYGDGYYSDEEYDVDPETDLLVARALTRIKQAKERGLANVSLPTNELEALERQTSYPSPQSSRRSSKSHPRKTSPTKEATNSTRSKPKSRRLSIFGSSPKQSRSKTSSSKKAVGAAAPDEFSHAHPVTANVLGYDPHTGERIYAPVGYVPSSTPPRGSRPSSRSTSRAPYPASQYMEDDPRLLRSRARASSNVSAYSRSGLAGDGDPFAYQTGGNGSGREGASTPPYVGRRIISAPGQGEVLYSNLRRVPVAANVGAGLRGVERRESDGSSSSENQGVRVVPAPMVPEEPDELPRPKKSAPSSRRRRRK
jgi:hypothetical protein